METRPARKILVATDVSAGSDEALAHAIDVAKPSGALRRSERAGTHGRTGIAHAMLGSVVERVVRRASSPVLTVPFSRKAA